MFQVKAFKVGEDWELDVLAIPFDSKDSDAQWFDADTDTMSEVFTSPAIVYYHGINPDGRTVQKNPPLIGKAVRVEKKADGWHVRVLLDKTHELAKRIWEAAKKGLAAASSGSIGHLARMGDGSMYDKGKPGRIAKWAFAELSLIDIGEGRQPANRYAVALPALKSVYEQAGIALPDMEEPELESAGDALAESEASITIESHGENLMSEKEEKALSLDDVQATVAAALKADREAREAELKVSADAKALEDLKAENEALKTKAAEGNRLPGGAPYVAKHGDTWKFDNLSPGEIGLVVDTMKNAGRQPSAAAYKALALRLEDEKDERGDLGTNYTKGAMKAAGVDAAKAATDPMYSTASLTGSDWVGTSYSRELWQSIRSNANVASRIPTAIVEDGYSSKYFPLESSDPTWYKVPEATASDATLDQPATTITASQMATATKQLSLVKMGARVMYTGELVEDSLISFVPQLRQQLAASGQEQFDHAVIDGDTETSASTNINAIDTTPGTGITQQTYLLVDGFRKLALITNTANSRDGGALDIGDYVDTMKLMGTAGMAAADMAKVSFIVDPNVHYANMKLAEALTKDVYSGATFENGFLKRAYGVEIIPSWQMHNVSAKRMANAAGVIDADTDANNTKGAILCVRWDQWKLAYKRRMTMEVTRIANADSWEIVALARWGLAYRDTEASAISYNITV